MKARDNQKWLSLFFVCHSRKCQFILKIFSGSTPLLEEDIMVGDISKGVSYWGNLMSDASGA